MPLEWIIFQIFINTIEVGVLFYLLCSKFAAKGNKSFIPTLTFIGVSVGVLSLRMFIPMLVALPTTEIYLPIACFVYLLFFRDGQILNKLFWSLISFALLAAITFLSLSAIVVITGIGAYAILAYEISTERMLVIVISKVLQIAIFYILSKRKLSYKIKNSLYSIPIMICFSVPMISAVLMTFMFILLEHDIYITTELHLPIAISYLIINIMVFALYEIISRESEKNYMLIAKNKQYEMAEQYSKQVVEMYDKMSEWRHDYKHHMGLILVMLEKSDKDENSEAIHYIKELNTKVESSLLEITTGNTVVDAIVSSKMASLSSYGITFEHNISLPAELSIDNTDLCSILSNLLDNAIEACCKLSENRYINIEMLIFKNQLNIKVINATDGKYKIENGKLKTTKSGDLHGIGIGHIKSIVESYGGILDIKPGATVFNTHISIPLPKSL